MELMHVSLPVRQGMAAKCWFLTSLVRQLSKLGRMVFMIVIWIC